METLKPTTQESVPHVFSQEAYDTEISTVGRRVEELVPQVEKERGKISVATVATMGEWNHLNERIPQLNSTGNVLIEKIKDDTEANISSSVDRKNLIRTAIHLLETKGIERQIQIAEEQGGMPAFVEANRLMVLAFRRAVQIKFGGISIKELAENSSIPPVSFYRFAVESRLAKLDLIQVNVLDNKDPLDATCPNILRANINNAVTMTNAILDINANVDRSNFDLSDFMGIELEIYQKAVKILEALSKANQRTYETIFNPSSHSFPALKAQAQEYLERNDQMVSLVAIVGLGIITDQSMLSAYRRSRQLATTGNNREFYKLLADSIRKVIEEFPQEAGFLTKDNVASIINTSKNNSSRADGRDKTPSFEDLKILASAVFTKTEGRIFGLEKGIENIDWKNVVIPQKLMIGFPTGRHNKLDIALYYESKTGEAMEIILNFNFEKSKLEWPFIESPEDPEMIDVKNALLSATKSILLTLHRFVDKNFQEEQKKQNPSTVPIDSQRSSIKNSILPNKPPREIREKELKPKAKRPEPKRPLSPIQAVLNKKMQSAPTKGVKEEISLDIEAAKDNMDSNRISIEDQDRIILAIKRFNKDGLGTFKALKFKRNGEKLFELKVRNFRVLVTEENGNGNGKHVFTIVDVRDGKDLFRKGH